MKRSARNRPVARESGTVLGWTQRQDQELVRSRLVVNQVRGACKREDVFAATTTTCSNAFCFVKSCIAWSWPLPRLVGCVCGIFHARIEEEVFVRPPKNMRKDKTIWRLLRAIYGTQVASSRWQSLVRETLGDAHWKVLTSVPCVAYNETEDSLVMFHGGDFLAEGHDSSLDKLDEVLGAFEIKRLPRIGPGSWLGWGVSAQNDTMERIWILVSTRSQTRGCIDCDFVAGTRETCCNAMHT